MTWIDDLKQNEYKESILILDIVMNELEWQL